MSEHVLDQVFELDWMLQNGQIDDDVLAEALISEYYYSMRQLSLFLVKDFSKADLVIKKAVGRIVKGRHRVNGNHRIKTMLFASVVEESQRLIKKKDVQSRFSSAANRSHTEIPNQYELSQAVDEDTGLLAGIAEDHFLIVYLQFAHGYSSEEIAVITGKSSRSILQDMIRLRTALLAKAPSYQQTIQDTHSAIREQILSARCSRLNEEKMVRLDLHLANCKACKDFSVQVRLLDDSILQSANKMWSHIKLERPETLQWLTKMDGSPGNGHKKRFGFQFIELVMGTIALIFVGIMGWYGSQFYIMGSDPVSAETTPVNIFILKITATPRPFGEVKATADPSVISPSSQGPDSMSAEKTDRMKKLSMATSTGRLAAWAAHPPFMVSGSTALAAVLHYWGWEGTVEQIIQQLQPDPYRSILMPSELVEFVREQDGVKAISQGGGDFNTLLKGIDAGYPIIVQKGYGNFNRDGIADSYQVIYGYDQDEEQVNLLLEIGIEGSSPIDYDEFARDWKKSDFQYLIVYPETEENRVRRIFNIYLDMGFSKHLLMQPVGYEHYYR